MRAACNHFFFPSGPEIHRGRDYSHFFRSRARGRRVCISRRRPGVFRVRKHVGRVHAWLRGKMHRAKISRSLSFLIPSRSPVYPSSLRPLPPPVVSTTFKRVHFPPMRPHPRRAGNVNISLLAPRTSSPRAHVYNGGNCAEFQPLKCVGRARRSTGRCEQECT